MVGFVSHVALKFPTMMRALRRRRLRDELRVDTASTLPETDDDGTGLVSPDPAPPTISRRGALGLVGAGSATIFALTVGQSIGGWWRNTALLAPRATDPGDGPNGFQINKTAEQAGVTPLLAGDGWRLTLAGAQRVVLSRADLLAMPQHSVAMPIACVEGWSTDDQLWTGVRLRDLAALAGHADADSVLVESIQVGGFGTVSLRGNQIADGDSVLALQVNGVDLSLDHGYPARVMVPGNPGVHNTKWVRRMTFNV
jgi:DMSO/TMAO reductase YedYZ molybdopterin-dependent catalytic subunit